MTDNDIMDKCKWINNAIKWNYPDTYQNIINWCKDKIENYPFGHKCYWYYNQIQDFPTCPCCGKKNKKKITRSGYVGKYKYCCYDCVIKSRTEEDIKSITQKRSDTCISKYGYDNPLKVPEIHEKQKSTCINRYGNPYYGATEDHTKKIKKTCLERFGKQSYMQVKENCKRVTEKWQKTVLEKYGVTSTLHIKEVEEKSKRTCLEKYGEDNYSKTKEFQQDLNENRYNTIDLDKTEVLPLFTLDEYKEKGVDNIYRWKCKICGCEFDARWKVVALGQVPKCPICHKNEISISDSERQLRAFLETQCKRIDIFLNCDNYNVRNVIKPLELDIYIPQLKIAFEFDGLYWHNTNHIQDPDYHYKKTKMCLDKGICLYHIFEDMWTDRNTQIKSFINTVLNVDCIYAENVISKQIDIHTYNDFYHNNCIVFYPHTTDTFGLYTKDVLIGTYCLRNNTVCNLCIKNGYKISNLNWLHNQIELDTRLYPKGLFSIKEIKHNSPNKLYSYNNKTSYILDKDRKYDIVYDCGFSYYQCPECG